MDDPQRLRPLQALHYQSLPDISLYLYVLARPRFLGLFTAALHRDGGVNPRLEIDSLLHQAAAIDNHTVLSHQRAFLEGMYGLGTTPVTPGIDADVTRPDDLYGSALDPIQTTPAGTKTAGSGSAPSHQESRRLQTALAMAVKQGILSAKLASGVKLGVAGLVHDHLPGARGNGIARVKSDKMFKGLLLHISAIAPGLRFGSGLKSTDIPDQAVTASLHDRDFYGWVEQQCLALRQRDSSQLDWAGLEEELQALGRQEYRELVSRLAVLLGHLLQWELQPERRSRSWFLSIREQRRSITRLLEQNPSLRAKADQALADGFQGGIDLVLRETDLPLRALPVVCPWTLEASLDPATLCDTRADWSDLVG